MKTKIFRALTALIIISGCRHNARVISPAIDGIDIPLSEYSVSASAGDTLYYSSGSIIIFPANSFVDKKGRVVSGDVQVRYREFSNPVDFYLSGIPMDYEDAGKHYTFESSGMAEILAFRGSKKFSNRW